MDSVILARISDSVLDDDDWGIIRLIIREGKIVDVEPVTVGCYEFGPSDPQPGWTLKELLEWASYDGTGDPVEEYHELCSEADYKRGGIPQWAACSKEDLRVLLDIEPSYCSRCGGKPLGNEPCYICEKT